MGWGLFLLFGFLSDDFATFIVTAVRADRVGQAHLATVAASYKVAGFQGVMGATAITATLGKFSLWMWGHGLSPDSKNAST
jgi:hypothetical protein